VCVAAVIQSRVREAELTELQINEARDAYRHPPSEAARLWFLVADLAALHPMYSASLSAFTAMFQHCMKAAPTAATLEARMAVLVAFVFAFVHKLVSRGLKHDHKLVFAFVMAASGPRERGEVTSAEWELFVKPNAMATAAATSTAAAAAAAAQPQQTAGAAAAGAAGHVTSGAAGSSSAVAQAPAWCRPGVWAALKTLEAALPQQWQGLCQAVSGRTTTNSSSGGGGSSSLTGSAAAAAAVSWQYLLLHGSVEDFLGSSAAQACAGGKFSNGSVSPCVLEQLLVAAGCVGKQELPGLFGRLLLLKVNVPTCLWALHLVEALH
jgi:hypothetical protein